MEAYVALAAIVVYLVLSLRAIERRLYGIECRLLAISRHVGLLAEAGSPPSEQVRRLAADRSKYVEALKTYREETGSDLKQARQAVDPLRPRAGDV